MATSGTSLFQSVQNEQIIRDAYELVGKRLIDTDQEKIESAQRSLNLLLSSLPNRQLNLWTVSQEMMALVANQNTYSLPTDTSDVLEVFVRYSVRNLNGVAASTPVTGGVAANAFDGNPETACTQTAPNGWISYQWTSQYAIGLVGIQSNATLTYTLSFEYSNDGATWTSALMPAAQSYTASKILWFTIPVPTLGTYFRVRETGGATLNVQELYFNSSVNDTPVSRESRSEYLSYPQKSTPGRPANFWISRTLTPTISLYPTPDANFNCLFYSRIVMPQDIGSLIQTPPIPSRFFSAITLGLASKLSLKEKELERYPLLTAEFEKELEFAMEEDREKVPLRIYGDFLYGYSQV